MKEKLDASILSANYNKAKYLDDFFLSIENSSVLPTQIVIVDDGSTDSSIEIINSYSKKLPIKLIQIKKNVGFANALNFGLGKCKGKIILRIDPDDEMDCRRIERQYEFMENNEDVDVLGSNNIYYFNKCAKFTFKSNFAESHDLIYKQLTKGIVPLSHTSIAVRRDFFQHYKYNQEAFPYEEYDLFARMALDGGVFHNLTDCLTYYRIYPHNDAFDYFVKRQKGLNRLRKMYFGKNTSQALSLSRVLHQFFFRKALVSQKGFIRFSFFILASFCNPFALMKRIRAIIKHE
ncbi:MAG: glycosyltransferase [Bacteroidales bacterium]